MNKYVPKHRGKIFLSNKITNNMKEKKKEKKTHITLYLLTIRRSNTQHTIILFLKIVYKKTKQNFNYASVRQCWLKSTVKCSKSRKWTQWNRPQTASFWPHTKCSALYAQSTTETAQLTRNTCLLEEYSHCNWPLWQLLPPLTLHWWARAGREISAISGGIIMLQPHAATTRMNHLTSLTHLNCSLPFKSPQMPPLTPPYSGEFCKGIWKTSQVFSLLLLLEVNMVLNIHRNHKAY